MISSNQDYRNAMKEMIRKVQSGYEPSFNASDEELELLSDCIKEGYIRGRTTYIDGNGHEQELRTLDGKMHPEIINHVIPPKGLAFLSEQDKRNEPDEIHAAKTKSDIEHQSLKWSKINTISSIVIGLLTIVATVLVAKFF